jgi:predicted transcriptional regulator
MKYRNKEKLGDKVLQLIDYNWPIHVRELVTNLGLENNNSNIKKVAYHIKKLEYKEKVRTKRIGKALVVWPYDMEKLRFIHEMLRE